MSTDLMTMDAASLAKLQTMANEQEHGSGGVRVPIIRINYDPESKIERGAWIIGQEKDNSGNIINEGKRVKGFVILEVKRRYNLYDQLNNDNNCCSPMFDYGEEVRGNKHGYVCGKTCPRRDKETFGAATCKAQYVPFGMAITDDNEAIFARAFIQGASYMPFQEYLDTAKVFVAEGKSWKLPTYAFMTLLSSKKESNKGTTYFVGQFTRGTLFSMEQIEKFASQLDQTLDVIRDLNNAMKKGKEVKTVESVTSSSRSSIGDYGAIDVTPHARTMSTIDPMPGGSDVPFDAAPKRAEVKAATAAEGLDFDIESAISKALGSF